jgi:hypothetical protein
LNRRRRLRALAGLELVTGVMAVRPAERGWRRRQAGPAAAPHARRPWWARLLAATTLESLLG